MPNEFFGQYLLKKGLKQKKEHHHPIFQISLGSKFQLQQTILVF